MADDIEGILEEVEENVEERVVSSTSAIKKIAAWVGALAAIVSSVWAIDSRYASAVDISEIQQNISTQWEATANLIHTHDITEQRIALEDKLFELDFKINEGKATSMDRALKQRYERRLNQLK